MSVFNNIQNALNAKLSAISGVPTIFWPNSIKEPIRGQNFVRPSLLPASSELYTLNNGNYHTGIYQIDIFVKLNNGTSEALLIADAIRDGFNRQRLNSSGTTVFIQNISMSQAERSEAWWRVYLEVNYLSVA